jgi:hypothetical protein
MRHTVIGQYDECRKWIPSKAVYPKKLGYAEGQPECTGCGVVGFWHGGDWRRCADKQGMGPLLCDKCWEARKPKEVIKKVTTIEPDCKIQVTESQFKPGDYVRRIDTWESVLAGAVYKCCFVDHNSIKIEGGAARLDYPYELTKFIPYVPHVGDLVEAGINPYVLPGSQSRMSTNNQAEFSGCTRLTYPCVPKENANYTMPEYGWYVSLNGGLGLLVTPVCGVALEVTA